MGLFNDVSSGLEGLVRRGNVGGLFLNVAHGLSDSAAKVFLEMIVLILVSKKSFTISFQAIFALSKCR